MSRLAAELGQSTDLSSLDLSVIRRPRQDRMIVLLYAQLNQAVRKTPS